MSLAIGGDISEISFSNPEVGTGFFYPMSGEEHSLDKGGFRSEDNKAIDGSGRLIQSMKRAVGTLEVVASNSTETGDYDNACAIAASTAETTWTIAMLNGDVWKGTGVIQGDIKLNTYKTNFTLTVVSGAGFKLQ